MFSTPTTFRQSATDADNHLKTNIAATYLQDQIDLSHHFQVVAGLRFDHFDLQYRNNRTGDNLRRIDNLVSPRAGLVYKPLTRFPSTPTTACLSSLVPATSSPL